MYVYVYMYMRVYMYMCVPIYMCVYVYRMYILLSNVGKYRRIKVEETAERNKNRGNKF